MIEYLIEAFFISECLRFATSPIMMRISAIATRSEPSGLDVMHNDADNVKNIASMILGFGKWSARRFMKYSDAAKVAKTGMSSRLNIECPNITGENPISSRTNVPVRQFRHRLAVSATKIIPSKPNIAFMACRTLLISHFTKTSDIAIVRALNHPLYIGCVLSSMLVSLPKLR